MTDTTRQGSTPDWLAAHGLEQDPFATAYRPEFFYADPAFLQRLDLLTHLLQFSDSLLVVLGEAGAGKTTLLRQLQARAADNWRLSLLRGEEAHSLDAVLIRLAQDLGMEPPPTGEAMTAERVMAHCADLREAMALPILVIDDAEQVPPSLLRALAGLAGDPGSTLQRLRILLLGTPALEGLLAQAGLAPGLAPFVQTLNVPRFNELQAASYLMYRLTVAGYGGESPFSSTEVRGIAKASEGLPGAMNALAREALQAHAGRGALPRPRSGARRRWLLVLPALLLVGLFWWLQDTEPDRQEAEVPPLAQRPLSLPPLPATGTIQPRAPVDAPTVEAEAAREAPPAAVAAPDADADAEAEPRAAVPADRPEAPELSDAGIPVPAESADAPTTPSQAEGASAPGVPASPPEVAPEPEPASPAPEPAPPAPAVESAPATGLDWIRAQPGERYTLQLLVSRSEDSVRAFVARHGLEGDMGWYHWRQRGEDRYTLLYGSYPSLATAQAAVAGLPAAVQRDKPWPRSFTSVQAQLPDS